VFQWWGWWDRRHTFEGEEAYIDEEEEDRVMPVEVNEDLQGQRRAPLLRDGQLFAHRPVVTCVQFRSPSRSGIGAVVGDACWDPLETYFYAMNAPPTPKSTANLCRDFENCVKPLEGIGQHEIQQFKNRIRGIPSTAVRWKPLAW
jgi:hypothetical protein